MQPQVPDPAPSVRADFVMPADVPSDLRRKMTTQLIPWLSSLALHACVVVLGLTLARVVLLPVAQNQAQEVIPDPPTTFDNTVENLHIGYGKLPELTQARQDKFEVAFDGTSRDKGKSIDFEAAGGSGGDQPDVVSVFGAGPAGGKGRGPGGPGGTGDHGEGGPLARFSPNTPGGGGTKMFPPPSGAKRVIFACDASGSMINKIDALKHEMNKAIGKLQPNQAFNIFFFQDTKTLPLDPASMVLANSNNRRRASVFLEQVSPVGSTNPIPSLEAAFKQEPQLIYLLTDGDFPDNQAVLNRVRELNRDRKTKVRINTIAFTDEHDNEVEYLKILETIAEESGGVFRHVKMSDLED